MARYLMLMRDESNRFASFTEADSRALMEQFVAWTKTLHESGRLGGVERLTDAGRTVRKRGDAFTIDGPYAEARELVAGLYVLHARDYDEAAEIAKGCPLLRYGGSCELRAIGDFPKPT
jgi:hypothetical protein